MSVILQPCAVFDSKNTDRTNSCFAAFPDHCSLFPKASTIEAFKNELKGYSTSKGTIRFPVDQPLPTALVRKIVKARVAQNGKKKRG